MTRMGRKKRPFYRIVAVAVQDPRDGATLGQVGIYDPINAKLDIDEEAAVQWLNNGAQMTNTVEALLRSRGVLARRRGLEGRVRDDVLLRDKPKRRRKLGEAQAAAEEESEASDGEGPVAEETAVEEAAPVAEVTEEAPAAVEAPAEEEAAPAEEEAAAGEEETSADEDVPADDEKEEPAAGSST